MDAKTPPSPPTAAPFAGRRRSAALAAAVVALSTSGLAIAIGAPDVVLPPAAPAPPLRSRFAVDLDVGTFHKGNLHAHSLVSDGDVLPVEVYRWYRRNGYQFAALTDHNTRVEPKVYAHVERPGFKILSGEEITMKGGEKEVHVNALCTRTKIGGGTFPTRVDALRHATDAVKKQGGVAMINHPNFDRALELTDLLATENAAILEIWSGHPYVWSKGIEGRPSHEALWARALDGGARFAGAAVDDVHHIATNPAPAKAARPGRGWVGVYARPDVDVDRDSICDALRDGRFFASSGAAIARLRVAGETLTLWPTDPKAQVIFLGRSGEVLASERPGQDGDASYSLRGDEAWVRVRVEQDDGKQAWTQPFAVTRAPDHG